MMIKTKLGMIIVFFFCSISCDRGPPGSFVLSDFESEADLDRVQWQCHTLFSLSDAHATHGNKSLQLTLYPAAYPGIAFELSIHDWSSYERLSIDIYNPQEEVLSLAMRIDDTKEPPDFNDRYNNTFPIHPGMNHLRIPLAQMATSGTKRNIDVSNIRRCMLFMVQPHKKYVIYIDYMHLT